ncbi:hypothetical protein K439DRAFT_1619366 [Ramaria rubella]|nr:hypothetical protein K439DRAFT_1619366 [Ramaria rubella]
MTGYEFKCLRRWWATLPSLEAIKHGGAVDRDIHLTLGLGQVSAALIISNRVMPALFVNVTMDLLVAFTPFQDICELISGCLNQCCRGLALSRLLSRSWTEALAELKQRLSNGSGFSSSFGLDLKLVRAGLWSQVVPQPHQKSILPVWLCHRRCDSTHHTVVGAVTVEYSDNGPIVGAYHCPNNGNGATTAPEVDTSGAVVSPPL